MQPEISVHNNYRTKTNLRLSICFSFRQHFQSRCARHILACGLHAKLPSLHLYVRKVRNWLNLIYLFKPPGYFRWSYGAKPNSLSLTCACLCELFCSVPSHLLCIKAGSLLECESGSCVWTRWTWQIGTPRCQGNRKCSETYNGFVRECASVRVCQLLCACVSVRELEKWVRKAGSMTLCATIHWMAEVVLLLFVWFNAEQPLPVKNRQTEASGGFPVLCSALFNR